MEKTESFMDKIRRLLMNGGKTPAIKAVRYWNRDLLGPVDWVPVRNAAGKVEMVEMIVPVRERVRDRSKYKPHEGARQVARQRLGGFAGRAPHVIATEIEIARYDLAKERQS